MSELMKEPMTVGQILDKSVNFIFKNILWIFFLGILISSPELILKYLMPKAGFLDTVLLRLISILAGPFLSGTVAVILGEQFCGRKITWIQGFQKTTKRIIPLLLLHLLVVLATMVGALLLFVPMFIVLCATACAVPAMMIENLSPMKAFDRSWSLTKKNRMRIFGFFSLCWLITMLSYGFAALISHLPIDPIYQLGFTVIVMAAVSGLWPVVNTFIFLDLRIRKEAVDLDMEANTIAVEPVEVI